MKQRKLKIWNGGPYGILPTKDWNNGSAHVYVAAYSIKDIGDLCQELGLKVPSRHEIASYWSKDCWGAPMEGIQVERGVWVQSDHLSKPARIVRSGAK